VDAPFQVADGRLQARLLACVDVEEKIPRALARLGTVARRATLLLDARSGGFRARQLEVLGAQVVTWSSLSEAGAHDLDSIAGAGPTHSTFDVAIAWWAGFEGDGPGVAAKLAVAERTLAPGGRLLVVQDYGRDEVSALFADPARESRLRSWSDRRGPVLAAGFRVRTLHCWWTFRDLSDAADLLARAFPITGPTVSAAMIRPRLQYKIAIYHRVVGNRRVAT
jgi:hypothetical protein